VQSALEFSSFGRGPLLCLLDLAKYVISQYLLFIIRPV
jgi:hypothetical protein